MVLLHGRPENCDGRLKKEIAVYDFLDSLNIEYDRIDHEPADNMEVCAEKNAILQATICKNLVLCPRTEKEFYLLMMPAEKQFKTKYISKQIGSSRLSFAKPEQMESLLNVTPGSASVMGLIFDTEKRVNLIIDEDVLKGEYFGCHPCINTSSLKIKTSDLTDIILPKLGRTFKKVTLIPEEADNI